jgi:hypothetical protein
MMQAQQGEDALHSGDAYQRRGIVRADLKQQRLHRPARQQSGGDPQGGMGAASIRTSMRWATSHAGWLAG